MLSFSGYILWWLSFCLIFEWTANILRNRFRSVLDEIICGLVSWWKLVLVNSRTTGLERIIVALFNVWTVYLSVCMCSVIRCFSFYSTCLLCICISFYTGHDTKTWFFLFHSAAHIHLNAFLYHYFCGNCNHPPTFQLPRLMEGHQSVYWAASPGLLFSSLTTPELFQWASQPHIKDRLATALAYYASLLKEHKSNEILNGIILACAHVSVCLCKAQRKTPYVTSKGTMCIIYWVTGKRMSKATHRTWTTVSSCSLTSTAHMCFRWLVICALSLSQHYLLYWALHYQLLIPQCTVLITCLE